MIPLESFPENLKRLRKAKGLSQTMFAECLEMEQSSIGKWETGKTIPHLKTLVKIADFFDIPVKDLLK